MARWRNRRVAPRVSLTTRILAVNILALALLAASLFYLDSYRRQLLAERVASARATAEVTALSLAGTAADARGALMVRIGAHEHVRLLLFGSDGHLVADSFALAPPAYVLADPSRSPLLDKAARGLDRGMDAVLGAPTVAEYHPGPADAEAAHWAEVGAAARGGHSIASERFAPDRTPLIAAAAPSGAGPQTAVLLLLRNDPDFTQNVRDARQTLAIDVLAALAISVALSLFLARTIVDPLRALVRAAVRVRLGRDRAVEVPRLPDRRDEIGLLARALSDMTGALRLRIDAVEAFAADVAHEIKNPLASLRSALESLDKVEDAALRRQLAEIAAHDVRRIDRLITDIAEASRIDAELSRTTFEPVDLLALTRGLVAARQARGANGTAVVRITCEAQPLPPVAGDAGRLERVFENLLDNAVSFSPPGGEIAVTFRADDRHVVIEVVDNGPGIPPEARGRIFERFHSRRPAEEDFGGHSGLGLAIARTIIEAHDGTLTAEAPHPGCHGARLVITLPAWHEAARE